MSEKPLAALTALLNAVEHQIRVEYNWTTKCQISEAQERLEKAFERYVQESNGIKARKLASRLRLISWPSLPLDILEEVTDIVERDMGCPDLSYPCKDETEDTDWPLK